jgi:hypothetical protein
MNDRNIWGQLVPVVIGTVVFGTVFWLIGLAAGGWSPAETYGGAFAVLFIMWVIGVLAGARG